MTRAFTFSRNETVHGEENILSEERQVYETPIER